jgi:hypothetical protein
MRTRKLIGTILILLFVLLYFAIAMEVTARLLPDANGLLQLAGYLVAGLVWIVPVGLVIRWMSRPDAERR